MTWSALKGQRHSLAVLPISPDQTTELPVVIQRVGGTIVSHRRELASRQDTDGLGVHHDLEREISLIEAVARRHGPHDGIFLVETEWGLTKLGAQERAELWHRMVPPGFPHLGCVLVYVTLAPLLTAAETELRAHNRLLALDNLT